MSIIIICVTLLYVTTFAHDHDTTAIVIVITPHPITPHLITLADDCNVII